MLDRFLYIYYTNINSFTIELIHGKNGFAEIFKNFDTDLKIILLDLNNYVGCSS